VPPGAQDLQQLQGEHDVAILLPLVVHDTDDHPLTIEGGDREADGFGNAEAGSVTRGQVGAMQRPLHPVEKLHDLLGAEHDGEGSRLLRQRHHLVDRPPPLEGDAIEKPERRHRHTHGARREPAFNGQIHLVRANLLGAHVCGRLADVARELRDARHIRALGERRQLAQLHVFEQALTKGCHGTLLCEGLGDSRRSHRSV
jgi:hypothetical protein